MIFSENYRELKVGVERTNLNQYTFNRVQNVLLATSRTLTISLTWEKLHGAELEKRAEFHRVLDCFDSVVERNMKYYLFDSFYYLFDSLSCYTVLLFVTTTHVGI